MIPLPPFPAPVQPAWQQVGADTYALAESPFWHPHEQMLYWLDIPGKKLLRANVYTAGVQAWDMPSEPGCMAPAATGGLVLALRHGVFRARNWGGALECIATLPYDTRTVRANDGKCDTLGRFWVGTIDEPKAGHAAELFCIDGRPGAAGSPVAPRIHRKAGDALTANGLAWGVRDEVLYWADTPNHVVHAWDFAAPEATLTGHRIHLRFEAKPAGWDFTQGGYAGRPDGAAVDAEGNYWVALFEGARLCQFAPDGALLQSYATPAQCPTMPCFGGEDLRTLYLTTARHGRSAAELARYPASGGVFAMRVATPGLPVNFYQD